MENELNHFANAPALRTYLYPYMHVLTQAQKNQGSLHHPLSSVKHSFCFFDTQENIQRCSPARKLAVQHKF